MQAVFDYFANNGAAYAQMVGVHLGLSALACLIAVVIAVPLGIVGARFSLLGRVFEGVWGTLRIVPSLALLFIFIPFLGTGFLPAVVALVILAIPPVLINTVLAFSTLPADVIEAARGMGMPGARLFFTVKVPLSFPMVFAGIRTAAVEVIASATLAAYIGAGGLGTIIITGLGLMRPDLLWIGGLSVAVLSLGCGGLLACIDRRVRRYERASLKGA